MANPVKWSNSKVGYDPGQKQSWEISFKSRNEGNVTVSYVYKATSLGQDDYTSKQRYNQVTLKIGSGSTSFTYQLHGNKTSTTKKGTFTINKVSNGTTSLKVLYTNKRKGVNTPNYGPKSTGDTSTEYGNDEVNLGSLTISDNTKCTITYDSGYQNGNISNLPESFTTYKGAKFNISNNILVDNKDHYVFNKGYTLDSSEDVNVNDSPTYKLDTNITISGNTTYYACWLPQVYTYRFFKTSKFEYEYDKLSTNYKYTGNPVILPNLNDLTNNNLDINSIYYNPGYNFNGWNSDNGEINLPDLECTFDSNTRFFPKWQPITSKIIFDYNFDDYTREVPYTYGNDLDFTIALKNQSDEAKNNTMLRPGYKLVGWTYSKSVSDTIYEPFKAPSTPYKFDSRTNITYPNNTFSNMEFINNGLTLYAVWEYYTTIYVYDNGSWKLALPYVYTNKNGVSQWNIALTYNYTDSWKL